MAFVLKSRRIGLEGACHLELDPDGERPDRYLVRFFGLHQDPAARAATQRARVRLMLAQLHGEAPFPSPLPHRVTIGWLDRTGWHPGRSPLAAALADMEPVQRAMRELADDLMTRVALVAAAADQTRLSPDPTGSDT
ncbi:MAG: hypothetical protein ACM3ST_08230 [Bdellovibrio bacteriovorus]